MGPLEIPEMITHSPCYCISRSLSPVIHKIAYMHKSFYALNSDMRLLVLPPQDKVLPIAQMDFHIQFGILVLRYLHLYCGIHPCFFGALSRV